MCVCVCVRMCVCVGVHTYSVARSTVFLVATDEWQKLPNFVAHTYNVPPASKTSDLVSFRLQKHTVSRLCIRAKCPIMFFFSKEVFSMYMYGSS